jgi:2-oxoisovalerate dehydrogenase E1 component
MEAAAEFPGSVEIIDLRTIVPVDMDAIRETVCRTNRCMVLTEEPVDNSFGQSLAGRIATDCFEQLDAPPVVVGSVSLPAIPLNSEMEAAVLPSAEKVKVEITNLLNY